MPVYTCSCCNFETENKTKYTRHLSTQKHRDCEGKVIVPLKDKYQLMEEKYQLMEEKHQLLEEKHKLLEEKYALLETELKTELKMLKNVVNMLLVNKTEAKTEPKTEPQYVETKQTVCSTIELLNESHFETPNLKEMEVEMVMDDFDCPHVEGMTKILQRIKNKPFQYVDNKWYVKSENQWSYDEKKSFIPYVRHLMVKRLPILFAEVYGKINIKNEDDYTRMVYETFKELEPAHVKHILRSLRNNIL